MIAFSHPWALALALPAAWLLWRSRRRTVESHVVANLFLWMDAGAEPSVAGSLRALPPWLTWVQAAVLVAIAVAIAQPFRRGARPEAALVVDLSMSMSARDEGTTRLREAQQAAKNWLGRQPADRRVEIIGAGSLPRAVATIRAGSGDGSATIDRLAADAAVGDLSLAIELARHETTGPIAVISDRSVPAAAASLGITWQQIGAPADNVAITRFAPAPDGGAMLEVTNFGRAARDVDIRVTGGAREWREQVTIAAAGTRAFAFAAEPDRTVVAIISLETSGDAITADNRLELDVRRQTLRVAVDGGSDFVRAAVGALPDVTLEESTDSAALRPTADVLVTTNASAARTVPTLTFGPGGATPVVTRSEINGRRQIDVAVDLETTDWPLRPAFPIFIADAIDWLGRRRPAALSPDDVAWMAEADTQHSDAPVLATTSAEAAAPPSKNYAMALVWLALIAAGVDVALRQRRAARAIAMTLLTAAAFGVAWPFGGSNRSAAIVIDESVSVSGAQRKAAARARSETEAAGGGDRASTIRFGGAETDISAGIRAARAALPAAGDRRMLLMTDGQETNGDSVDEARKTGAGGIPIDVVPIDSRSPAYISRIDVPSTLRAGTAVPVRVSVTGAPGELVRLTVARDGRQLDARRIVLNDEGHATVELTDRPQRSGAIFYRATLAGGDGDVVISESGAATSVAGRGKLLLITDRHGAADVVRTARSFDIDTVTSSSTPDTRDALAPYSAIVIDAVPLHFFSARQRDALAAAVTLDEAGLLFLGSRESLDPSEFSSEALSGALPIDFTMLPKPPATRTALALLVDISGSMASTSDGVTKIAAARDAIARALAILPKTDAVEVIGFAAQPTVLIGPDDPRDAASVEAKLKTLAPSGTTAIGPAARAAAAWLKSASSARRRLLLVTDGKTSAADAEAARAAVRGQSIEVSAVTIGRDAERGWLTELAATTGGRAYFPDRLTDLSREVARETARGATGREINERFDVRSGDHPLAPGLPAPSLGGYIAGRLRDGAVAAWKGPADEPVLAAWTHGLGRVAAFASDEGGDWGAPLRGWSGGPAFWRRAFEWLARPADSAPADAQLITRNGAPRIVANLQAVSQPGAAARAVPHVSVVVTTPSGQTFSTMLHAVTPSVFEGPAILNETGDYRAAFTVTDAATGTETRLSRGWYWNGDRESDARGMNTGVLEQIARASGGRMLPTLGTPAGASETVFGIPRRRAPIDAAPWLLMAALALLSFDYIRRAGEAL